MNSERIFLNVQAHEAKSVETLGAKHDASEKGWWIPSTLDRVAFRQWLPRMYRTDTSPPYLTCELVPTNSWFMNLRKWLPTKEWDKVRKESYKAAGYRCLVCGGKGPQWPVECNEQWQYIHDANDPSRGIQKLLRLAALCPACHSVKHAGFASLHGKLDYALKQLGFVNGWTKEQCNRHLDEAEAIHAQRSKMNWTYDISLLQKYGITGLTIDFEKYSLVPPLQGISFRYRNVARVFNSMTIPFVNRKLSSHCSTIWKNSVWAQLAPNCPIGVLKIGADDQVKLTLIDCLTSISFTDDHIDALRNYIAQSTADNEHVVLLNIANHPHENDVIIVEAIDAEHPRYVRVEFDDKELGSSTVVTTKNLKFSTIDEFLKAVEASDHQLIPNTYHATGLEFLFDDCPHCEKEIYRFTGLVFVKQGIEDWQSEIWRYSKFVECSSLSPKLLETTANRVNECDALHDVPVTHFSPEMHLSCPYCSAKLAVGKVLGMSQDDAREAALETENARTTGLLAYVNANFEIDYATANQTMHSFEFSPYSCESH